MPEAHTIIAMIATVLLLWGASLIARALRFRLPPLRIRRRWHGRPARAGAAAAPQPSSQPPSLPGAAFGALISAASIPVFWASAQVYLAYGTRDPSVEPFTPWTGVALGCIAFGLAVMAWAIRGDRPRGRRRCRRCWYDMTGAPGLTCPECGRKAPDAADLLRPRRKWRLAVVGLVIALLAVVPYHVPRVQRGGWVAAIPTTALILGLPWWPDAAIYDGAGDEDWSLAARLQEERMARWQVEWLRGRARGLARRPHPGVAQRAVIVGGNMRDHVIMRTAAGSLIRYGLQDADDEGARVDAMALAGDVLNWVALDGGETATVANEYIDSLTTLIQRAPDGLAVEAAEILPFATDYANAVPALVAMFQGPVPDDYDASDPVAFLHTPQFTAAYALAFCTDEDADATRALCAGLERRDSPPHLLGALWALRRCSATTDGLERALTTLLMDPPTAPVAAVAIARRPTYAHRAFEQLLEYLESDPEPPLQLVYAAQALFERTSEWDWRMMRLLEHQSWDVRRITGIALAYASYDMSQDQLHTTLASLRMVRDEALEREASEDIMEDIEYAIDEVAVRAR